LTNKPDINPGKTAEIEAQIRSLNEEIIKGSTNLQKLRDNLKELNKTVFARWR
jgi:hypothetical protein